MPQPIVSQFDRKYGLPIETYRSVQNVTQRNNIPDSIRWEGMIVHVISDQSYILLDGTDNTKWEPLGGLVNVNVVDNLLSTSPTDALSANQGRVLDEKIRLSSYRGEYTVVPDTFSGRDIANTGLAYKPLTEQYIVARHDEGFTSELWFFDRNSLIKRQSITTITPTPDRVIDVSSHISWIQGISYDDEDNSYWMLGTSGTPDGTNNILVHIDDTGALLSSTALGFLDADFRVGNVAINNYDDEIIIKPDLKAEIWFLDKTALTLSRTETTNSTNETFGFDPNTKDLWIADNDGNIEIRDYTTFEILKYRYIETFPQSGVGQVLEQFVLGDNNKLIVSADSYYHGGQPNGNVIIFYDRDDLNPLQILTLNESADQNPSIEYLIGKSINPTAIGWKGATDADTGYNDAPLGLSAVLNTSGSTGFPTSNGISTFLKRTAAAGNSAGYALHTPFQNNDNIYVNIVQADGSFSGWSRMFHEKDMGASSGLVADQLPNDTPSTAADTGVAGEIRYDTDYIYVCIATDTWKRVGIATW